MHERNDRLCNFLPGGIGVGRLCLRIFGGEVKVVAMPNISWEIIHSNGLVRSDPPFYYCHMKVVDNKCKFSTTFPLRLQRHSADFSLESGHGKEKKIPYFRCLTLLTFLGDKFIFLRKLFPKNLGVKQSGMKSHFL